MSYGLRRFADYALEPAEGMARFRCEWVSEPSGLEIYLRRHIRYPGVITLANITLPEKFQRQGIFTRFIDHWSPQLPLFIEHVHNPYLESWLKRKGWHLWDLDNSTCYYNDLASAIIDKPHW